MKIRHFLLCFLFFTLLITIFLLPCLAQEVEKEPLVIGIVTDGRAHLTNRFIDDVRTELKTLLSRDMQLIFKESQDFDAGWKMEKVREVLWNALNDPETDLILCAGIMATLAAGTEDRHLTKPVVGGFYLDPDFIGLPMTQEGLSAKENFTFIAAPQRVRNDLTKFKELVEQDVIHIAFDASVLGAIPDFRQRVAALGQDLGLDLTLVPYGDSPQEFFSAFSSEADAVYLTPGFRMEAEEWKEVLERLARRGVLTFSLRGETDVRQGALAGITPDLRTRIARRTALHIQMITDGSEPTDLPVLLPLTHGFFLNMRTASTLGWAPSFDLMQEAVLVHRRLLVPEGEGAPLSLPEAMKRAAEKNPVIVSAEAQRDIAEDTAGVVRGGFFPQLSADATWQRIDRDRAEASLGIFPQRRLSAGVRLEQLIFDDSIISRYRQARRSLEGSAFEEQAVIQDVMLEAGLRFLALLSAEALLVTEYENLEMTQSNLELAKVRREVGAAGPEEVFRFETLLAETRSRVLQRESQLRQALASLNRSMGLDQDTSWKTVDITQDEALELLFGEGFIDLVSDMQDLGRLRAFSIDVAMERMRIQAMKKQMEAAEIEIGYLRRSFFLPSVSASVSYERRLEERRLTPDLTLPGFPELDPDPGRDDWTVGVKLSIPLFEGGTRMSRLSRSKAEFRRLQGKMGELRQRTEEEVRRQLDSLYYSYPAIELRQKSAQAARRNFELVRERYQRGAASILDLLDAQTQAVGQEQAASVAVYTMISDLLRFQRAIAWMETLSEPVEKAAFRMRFERFLESSSGRMP